MDTRAITATSDDSASTAAARRAPTLWVASATLLAVSFGYFAYHYMLAGSQYLRALFP